MTITEQIVHLSAIQFWLFALLAAGAAVAAFYFAFRHLHLARLIENTPTTQVAHAQQGYVELDGIAHPSRKGALSAPLSGITCCWYEYKIEKRGNKSWRTLEHERSSDPFLLDDDSGRCLIEPEGAQITVARPQLWYGNNRRPTVPNGINAPAGGWSVLTRNTGLGARYRYTETRIHADDTIYAIGEFRTHDDLDRTRQIETRRRELLRAWKRAPQQLLARFDSNRDGRIDPDEWQQARLAAAAQSGIDQRLHEAASEAHRLTKPINAHLPYLISTLPQFTIVKHFQRRALGLLIGALLCGSIGVWLIGTRFAA